MKTTVAVAISGGVDSLTTAWLLKAQGYRVIGVHFVTGYETYIKPGPDQTRPDTKALLKAAQSRFLPITRRLNISFEVLDCTDRFKSKVVDYFVDTYREGQTPSPCMVCNPTVKFGALLNFAKQQGAERLATGHYARVCRGPEGWMHLYRGVDPRKDQSYFLSRLSPVQLEQVLFPLGDMTKSEVIALADQQGLLPITDGESQDICFISAAGYGEFLDRQAGFTPKPGPIVTIHGQEVGRHPGLHLFTIGQRRGINCPDKEPYYVVRIEPAENRLVVGRKADIFSSRCQVEAINWIVPPPARPIEASVKIRYRHNAFAATVVPIGHQSARVQFDQAQPAVTPGQGAVFYREDEVLGGGWIVGSI